MITRKLSYVSRLGAHDAYGVLIVRYVAPSDDWTAADVYQEYLDSVGWVRYSGLDLLRHALTIPAGVVGGTELGDALEALVNKDLKRATKFVDHTHEALS